MRLNTYLLLALVLVLAMAMGCSSGSSSSGGGSSATIVGIWKLVSSTGGTWPQQVTFNSDGTGSNSGGNFPNGTLTWSQSGSSLVITFQEVGTIINNVPSPVGNTVTLKNSIGQTATYSRI